MFVGSPIVDGPVPMWEGSVSVAGGRYLPKESLQKMLAEVEARAGKN
jgi:hypothetical protein